MKAAQKCAMEIQELQTQEKVLIRSQQNMGNMKGKGRFREVKSLSVDNGIGDRRG